MIALFFSTDVSHVIRELKEREELHKFAGVVDVPSELQIYEFLSRFSKEQFMNCVRWILNTLSSGRKRYRACILVDFTDITSDLNWICRKSKKNWRIGSSNGFILFLKSIILDLSLKWLLITLICVL